MEIVRTYKHGHKVITCGQIAITTKRSTKGRVTWVFRTLEDTSTIKVEKLLLGGVLLTAVPIDG